MNANHSAPSPDARCRLLELPAELRLCIYEHLWDHLEAVNVRISTTSKRMSIKGRDERAATGALLKTCKIINKEARPIMYSATAFELCFQANEWPCFQPLNLAFLPHVRDLSLYFDLNGYERRYEIRALGRKVEHIVRVLLQNQSVVIDEIRIEFPHDIVHDNVARPKTLLQALAKLRVVTDVFLHSPHSTLQLSCDEYPSALKVLAGMKKRWSPTKEDLEAMKLEYDT